MSVGAALLVIGMLLGVTTACMSLWARLGNEESHPLTKYVGGTAIALILVGIFTYWGW